MGRSPASAGVDLFESTWFRRTFRTLVGALLALVGLTFVIFQYFFAVFWFEGRHERDLAREGIVQGGDALNQAVVPALWLTLAVVAVEAATVILALFALRRARARRQQP
jgi:hypothetical protein